MASFEKAAEKVLKFEGGYVNDPDDPGGETNRGITINTAKRGGFKGEMKDLTEDDAMDIYERLYWIPLHLNHLADPGLALVMFDAGVNMGLSWPVQWLQAILNDMSNNGSKWKRLVEDGLMGPATLGVANIATVQAAQAHALKETILNNRLQRYQYLISRNPALAKFDKGWKNRVATLRSMIQHPDMQMAAKEEQDGTTPRPESS